MRTATSTRRRVRSRKSRISLEEVVASARARERSSADARLRALRKRITARMRGLPASEQLIREMRDAV